MGRCSLLLVELRPIGLTVVGVRILYDFRSLERLHVWWRASASAGGVCTPVRGLFVDIHVRLRETCTSNRSSMQDFSV
jgi:hypothetical protein